MDIRYGSGDIVVDEDTELPKYVTVYDINGNPIEDVRIYYIEDEGNED